MALDIGTQRHGPTWTRAISPSQAHRRGRNRTPRRCRSYGLSFNGGSVTSNPCLSTNFIGQSTAYTHIKLLDEEAVASESSVQDAVSTTLALRQKAADEAHNPCNQYTALSPPQKTLNSPRNVIFLVINHSSAHRGPVLTPAKAMQGSIGPGMGRLQRSTVNDRMGAPGRLHTDLSLLKGTGCHSVEDQAHAYPFSVLLSSALRYKELLHCQQDGCLLCAARQPPRLNAVVQTRGRGDKGATTAAPAGDSKRTPPPKLHIVTSHHVASRESGVSDVPQDTPGSYNGNASQTGHLTASSSYGQNNGVGGGGAQARNRAWSHSSNRSTGGSGDGGGGSAPLSPGRSVKNSIYHSGFNCVFCGTSHRSVVGNCSTKKKYISQLQRHHESRHGFLYCTDCFGRFGDAQTRRNHKIHRQCVHKCVSEGCPNKGRPKSMDTERCTHVRNPARDQWIALFHLAQGQFHFAHPEGCPDPGHGAEEEALSNDEPLLRLQNLHHLQPPPDLQRSLSRNSLATHSTSSAQAETPLQSPLLRDITTHDSVPEQNTVLISLQQKLAELQSLVHAMQQFDITLTSPDLRSIEQTLLNMEFCRQQLAQSCDQAFAQLHHEASPLPARVNTAPQFLGTPQQIDQLDPNYISRAASSYNDVESTSQIGALFPDPLPMVPSLSFDTHMADLDMNMQSEPPSAQSQEQQQYWPNATSNNLYQDEDFAGWP